MSGSATQEGFLYHEPAFPIAGYKYNRTDNQHRLGILLKSQDWEHKNVLDMGCNVGYFAIKLAMKGARTLGIDIDEKAIEIAKGQADEYGIENCNFDLPGGPRRFIRGKNVLLAFAVLQWIYTSEPDPEKYIAELFEIPVAYVEIPYPPDGRANIPGVFDDATAKAWLGQFYPFVFKVGETDNESNGVTRKRSMWKCVKEVGPVLKTCYGSQANIKFFEHFVIKSPRTETSYDPFTEYDFLKKMAQSGLSPKPIGINSMSLAEATGVIMERIHGDHLMDSVLCETDIIEQFDHICKALEENKISHNDIRPGNLIYGNDGNIYLLDYGLACSSDIPEKIRGNSMYRGNNRESFDKIFEMYKKWNLELTD